MHTSIHLHTHTHTHTHTHRVYFISLLENIVFCFSSLTFFPDLSNSFRSMGSTLRFFSFISTLSLRFFYSSYSVVSVIPFVSPRFVILIFHFLSQFLISLSFLFEFWVNALSLSSTLPIQFFTISYFQSSTDVFTLVVRFPIFNQFFLNLDFPPHF